jgi:hypothetical protein
MSHRICRIGAVKQMGPYVLRVRFDDGMERTIDFEPLLAGQLYGPLRDPGLFAQVSLDPEVHRIVWPNGADFDPATLYDWPEHEGAFRAAANSAASTMQCPNHHSSVRRDWALVYSLLKAARRRAI